MIFHWNVDPEIFSLGPVQLRWYGVLFLTGFLIGYRLLDKMCRWEGKPTEPLDALLIYLIAGTAIGARLGHCFFYEAEYYLQHPLEVFQIWKGGLASHGGGVGVIISLVIFSRRHPEFSIWWLFDRVAFPTAMTGGFIRLGNVMNSEILGRPTGGDWGVVFDRVDKIPRHPTQIYESVCYFVVAYLGYRIYLKYKERLPWGLVFGFTFAGLFLARFFLEFFKENQVGFEQGMPLNMGQILSIPYVLIGIGLVVRALRAGPAIAPSSVSAKEPKKSKKKIKKD